MSDGRRDYAILASLSMREEAEVVASALRADGIDAFVGNAHHANVDWGYTIALGGIQVLVPREKLDEAREAIRERVRDAAKADDGEPVKRRDRYKLWLIIAGYFVLGLFGVNAVASHEFDVAQNQFHFQRSMAQFDLGMTPVSCLPVPAETIPGFARNSGPFIQCDVIERPGSN